MVTFKVLEFIAWFVVLAATSLVCQAKTVASSGGNFILSDRSFAIQSSIARHTRYRQVQSVHLNERYSFEQKRAIIKYHLGSKEQTGDTERLDELYYDLETGASVSFDRERSVCNEESVKELYQNLFGMHSALIFELMQLADTNANTKHLIGPARLLFLVSSRFEEMRAIFWPAQEKSATIRNHQVAEFVLELYSKKKTKFVLLVYYDRTAFEDAKRSLVELVPLQIVVKTPDSGEPVVVDYYRYQFLTFVDDNKMQQQWPLQLDEFVFPMASDCGALVVSQLSQRGLFSSHDFESLRVSFKATSLWQTEKERKQIDHFVAYDGMTRSMRIDYSLGRGDNYCLTDFRTGRTYSSVGADGCLVTQTLKAAGSDSPLSFALLLIGTDSKLTYMGLAQVRGAKSKVFEVHSDQLPHWFSQPQPVRSNGSLKKRLFGVGLKFEEDEQPKMYSTLVYMSEDLSQLLHLEIYDLNRARENRRILSAAIKDFMYELNEATNGDSWISLFDLRDRCGLDGPDDGYAQVDLLLEEDLADEKESKGFYRGGHWLINYLKRNDALLSSLSDSLSLPLNLMYDLRSRLTAFYHKAKLSVSFRVAEHPRHFHTIHLLANARLRTLEGLEVIHPAQSPNECYLKLLSRPELMDENEGPIYLFYSQTSSRCVANRDNQLVEGKKNMVRTGAQVDLRKLEHFVIDDKDSPGELFMFEPSRDSASSLSTSWLREGKFEHLEGRLLVLQAARPGDPQRPLAVQEVHFRVRRAELRGVNQVSRVAAAAGDSRRRKQLMGFKFAPKTETRLAEGPRSLAECEAACLGADWCRLYSFCLRPFKTECLLSGASLVGEDRDPSGWSLKMGDLEADARCELREKLYLDLFQLGWPSTQTLGAEVEAVAGAQSAEDCARLCFLHNLELLKSPVEGSMSSFCRQFSYLNSELSDRQRRALGSSEANKFCLFKQHLSSWSTVTRSTDTSVTFVALNTFQFKFELLYEGKKSIGLRESSGGNIQMTLEALDAHRCAGYCLLQLSPLMCRSFDIRIVANTSICILNTGTMENSELIESDQLWHYEARFDVGEVGHSITLDDEASASTSLSWLLLPLGAIASGLWAGRRVATHLLRSNVVLEDEWAIKLTQNGRPDSN